ncbi:MAG: hypothetical protein KGK05_06610 [Xanthomonadaceae bacterium]|nr:hypothetical protein [Xanthomonadaceae bacterium]
MRFQCALTVAFGLILAACSGGNAPPPVDPALAAKAANEARAAKEGALYDQMRRSGSWDIATSLGNEILAKYPGTTAAARVQQTIAETRAKSAAIADSHRLAYLWTYTATAQDGGTQYAATIASKEPLKLPNARLRLVLRQHPKWGQSVYLLLDNATFDCKGGCATLPVGFDGAKPQHMKATIPPTGEPALFIDDDEGFIAKLEKAKTVAIGVNVKGAGEFDAEFEVGGFDSSKLPGRPMK